jgi:uncharacterized membrane protein (DUF4010 family)
LISSTATTVSVARGSKEAPGKPAMAAFVIATASAIVFLRVGMLLAATAPQFLRAAALPLGAMFAVLAVFGWSNLRRANDGGGHAMPEQRNPTELKPALLFGLLYAVVLLAVAAANRHFGQQGLYVAAVISGLTDMDAITLSVAQLVKAAEVSPGTGWRLIVVAAMANLAFKAATVAALGERKLFPRVALAFGAAAATGGFLIAFGAK